MDYSAIDPILNERAKTHGLHFYTLSKEDTAVRTTQIVDDSGSSYSVDISAPGEDGNIIIEGWRVNDDGFSLHCNISSLFVSLEEAYLKIEGWISEKGHTRTPVV